jgi:LuxR family maltose regulon positive regulatory protein
LADTATQHRSLFLIDTLILHAASLMKIGEKKYACRQLTKALKRSMETGFYQTFIDQKTLIEPVLTELLMRRQHNLLLQEDILIQKLERDLLPQVKNSNKEQLLELNFTEREREVITLLSSPLTVQEIADYVLLSKATIKTHLHNIYRKFGVKNRTGAIEAAARYDML